MKLTKKQIDDLIYLAKINPSWLKRDTKISCKNKILICKECPTYSLVEERMKLYEDKEMRRNESICANLFIKLIDSLEEAEKLEFIFAVYN